MKNTILSLCLLLAGWLQGYGQFNVRLFVDDEAKLLRVQIKNTSSSEPTTAQRISTISMRLLGSGVDQITGVASTGYTMLAPNANGLIAMNSTSLPCPENWQQDQYVTVVAYSLNPAQSYNASSFSVLADLDGDNSDVSDPVMSVQVAHLFNVSLQVEPTGALPVELSSFEVHQEGEDAFLEWTTSSEVNNEGFEIQRSVDGLTFDRIGWQEGKGTTSEAQQYGFVDKYLKPGTYYYRLKQMDYDGQFDFSNIRSLTISTTGSSVLKLYPNPTADFVYFSTPVEDLGRLSVFDANGRLLGQESIANARVDLRAYPPGTYFLNFEKYTEQRLIKVVKVVR